jgi:hypothetical protein
MRALIDHIIAILHHLAKSFMIPKADTKLAVLMQDTGLGLTTV